MSPRLVSVRAESITVVDKDTRDLWVLDAAKHTLDRVNTRVKEQYPTIDPSLFRKIAYDALAQIKM